MANIHFVRAYDFYGSKHFDIAYEKDGFITQVRTYPADELPKTVQQWLTDKTGVTQYSKVFRRDETVYQ